MDQELVFWYVLPFIIGLTILLKSLQLSYKDRGIVSVVALGLNLLLLPISLYMLAMMFRGAWPDLRPHLAIGISAIILLFQYLVTRRRLKNR